MSKFNNKSSFSENSHDSNGEKAKTISFKKLGIMFNELEATHDIIILGVKNPTPPPPALIVSENGQ